MRMQGLGWLIVGTIAAVAVPAAGVDWWLLGSLGRLAPWPWDRIFVGLLIFGTALGLHFRMHWVAQLRAEANEQAMRQRTLARLEQITCECERSAWLIGDNLIEAEAPGSRGQALYLDGARSHALHLRGSLSEMRAVVASLSGPSGQPEP